MNILVLGLDLTYLVERQEGQPGPQDQGLAFQQAQLGPKQVREQVWEPGQGLLLRLQALVQVQLAFQR